MTTPKAPEGGYTVVSTMKNEGAFLIEWVAHHKALGFDRILICTNDCDDPTAHMVQRLEALGIARHHATVKRQVTSIQRAALRQVLRYPEVTKAEWFYVCDADEFLTIKLGDGSVQALVAAAGQGTDAISIPWRIFGPNGQDSYAEGAITAQFTHAERTRRLREKAVAFPKTLCRGVEKVRRIGIHAPVPRDNLPEPLRIELPGGIPKPEGAHKVFVRADYRFAQINHYALRSRDSFLVKRDRGRVNHTNQTMDFDYWAKFDVAEERCDAIRRYDPAAAEWRLRMMADPELAEMHRQAVAWHRARIAALRDDPHFQPLLAAISERRRACEPALS